MKKNLLFILLFTPFISFSQTNIANWPLTVNKTGVAQNNANIVVGDVKLEGLVLGTLVTGSTQTGNFGTLKGMKVAPFELSNFSPISATTTSNANGWLFDTKPFYPGTTNYNGYNNTVFDDRYLEFKITVNTAHKANITQITLNTATSASNAGRFAIQYSKNQDFLTRGNAGLSVRPASNTVGNGSFNSPADLPNITAGTNLNDANSKFTLSFNNPNGINLEENESLYIRVFLHNNLINGTDKHIHIKNFTVLGEVIPATGTFTNPNAGVLPVNLLNYVAKKDASAAKLTWETATEQKNSHFEIFRSAKDTNEQYLGSVEGNGTINNKSFYEFTDRTPVSGTNYYKLIQIDADGKRTTLGTKALNFNLTSKNLLVWPNPFTNEFNLASNDDISKLEINDLSGKTIATFKHNFSKSIKINSAEYPSGLYLLKVHYKTGTTSNHKILKK